MSDDTPGSPSSSLLGPSSSGHTRDSATTRTNVGSDQSSPSSKIHENPASSNGGSVRHRKGRSGGFLLESLTRRARHPQAQRKYGTLKGKEKESSNVSEVGEGPSQRHSLHEYAPSIGSSPLASQVASVNGDDAQEGREMEPRRRPVSYSPHTNQAPSRQTDPATLVNLALQLSQSRARTVSARFNPNIVGAGATGRVLSGGSPSVTPQRSSSARMSTIQVSPSPNRSVGTTSEEPEITPGVFISNGLGTKFDDNIGDPVGSAALDAPGTIHFLPSPQTVVRAERAQIALELRYQHIRLLQYVPQLPHARNKRQRAVVLPGERVKSSDMASHSSTNSTALGRQYNPLQYARNRKMRYRLHQSMDAEAQGWKDVARVSSWIDDVARQSEKIFPSADGRYPLPKYGPPVRQFDNDDGKRNSFEFDEANRAKARPTLPRSDWIAHPWDLLADVYWVQQGNHRALLEDHNGDKIYASLAQAHHLDDGNRGSKFKRLGHDRNASNESASDDSARSQPINGAHSDGGPTPFGAVDAKSSGKLFGRKSSRKKSKVKRFSKRLSLATVSSSSSEQSNEGKKSRPWSSTFGKNWHGSSIPDRKSLDRYKSQPEDSTATRSSSEVPSSYRFSKEQKRPFSMELEPPKEDEKERSPSRAGDDTISDLDSTAPSSPINPRFPSSLIPDFDPKKIFGTPINRSRSNVVPKDKHRQVNRTDFADDPFDDGLPDYKQNGLSRIQTTALSSPSEASFSAASDDNRPRRSLQGSNRDRLLPGQDRDLGFLPLKPRKGPSAIVGRAKDLLRRREFGSDVSDSEEEGPRKLAKSPLSYEPANAADELPESQNKAKELVAESPQYQGLNLPVFRSTRPGNGSPPAKDRAKRPSLVTSHRHSASNVSRHHQRTNSALGSIKDAVSAADSPVITVSPALSQAGTDENDRKGRTATAAAAAATQSQEDSSVPPQSRQPSRRRGATVTDDAGNQWPKKSRTDAPPWPGQDHGDGALQKFVWTGPELKPLDPNSVSPADVKRAEVVLSSAIYKANFIINYYRSVPPPTNPPSLGVPTPLMREIRTYNAKQAAVSRLEEPRILAEHLAASVDGHTRALHAAASRFANDTQPALDAQFGALKERVGDGLTERVLAAGDAADELGARIATDCTLEVKMLNDRVDAIWRRRRRRSRFLRRIVFTSLEWTVLAVMWALWFVVVSFKLVRGTVRGVLGAGRWLFWLD